MSRWATVLAGGSGTRFWPLSTPDNPKQFLPLAGDKPLLRQTVDRLRGVVPADQIVVVTSQRFADRTRAMLPDLPSGHILAEPRPASTAPALTWASHYVRERDSTASMISVHADWHVKDEDAFRAAAVAALECAEHHDLLVTIGVVPSRPETGYGYILPGSPLTESVSRVTRFVEKPNRDDAAALIAQRALWNCGLFAWTLQRFFRETTAHAPEIAPHLTHLDAGRVDAFFHHVQPIPIDVSLFERSKHVAVVHASFGWDDVGTWSALSRVRPYDKHGNVAVGSVESVDARECIVWSPDGRVALYGVEGLVISQANGITLITTRERAAQLKEFVETLPPDWREPKA